MLVLDGEPAINELTFAADGTRLVAVQAGRSIGVWSLPDGQLLQTIAPSAVSNIAHQAVAVHPSGQWAFLAAARPLAVVSLPGADQPSVYVAGGDAMSQVIISPDGGRVVAHGHSSSGTPPLQGFRWDAGKLQWAWRRDANATDSLGSFVAAGERFVVIEGPNLVVRDAMTGEERLRVTYPSDYTFARAVSPDGSRFAVQGYSKLYVWDTATWGKPQRVECAGGRRFTALAFHPTRPLFAGIQESQGLVKFFDTVTWKLTARFAWKLGELRTVAFSPDGTLAAAGSASGKIVVWDVDV